MKNVWTAIALALALGGIAAAEEPATHQFVVDGLYGGVAVVEADLAKAPSGVWSEQVVVEADSVSLHFQGVALDAGESIVVSGANPDQTVSYDASAGSDFWTPAFVGTHAEIFLQNRDGGRTTFRVPEAVLGFNDLDSVNAQRARVAAEERRALGPPASREAARKAVYGDDDRQEVNLSTDENLKRVAKSVCLVVRKDELSSNGNGAFTLLTTPYTTGGFLDTPGRICAPEVFFNQPRAGFCSGFVVAPDLLATAGHCIAVEDSQNVAFVFDFQMDDSGTAPSVFTADQIYYISTFINRSTSGDNNHCIVKLTRPVVGRGPLPIRRSGLLNEGTQLAVVGHPEGLPMKIAANAQVKHNETAWSYFQANLDANKYGGAGSPVVNASNFVVEGISARGAPDFYGVSGGSCLVSSKYTDTTGAPVGNYVWREATKTSVWERYIPIQNFTPTPTAAPTSTSAVTATVQPTHSVTPTASPIPSVTSTPTETPVPTVSPVATISPTPQARAQFDFEFTPENWGNASVGGFVSPNFDRRDGALILSVTDNANTFGYWQLGTLRISTDGSASGKDPVIVGTNGADSLYRATVRLSCSEANAMLAPTIRMRASAGSNEQTSELMVSSATGTYSISPTARNYVQFFNQPAAQGRIRLAVDVLNVGGADTPSCEVRVESVLVEAMTKSALTGEVKELDRSLANDHVWTYGNAGGGYLPPVFERTADGLLVKGMLDQRPDAVVIGFWSSARGQDKVTLVAGRIYRADFTLATTAPASQRALLPTIRLRANDSSFNTAVLTNIESVNANVALPSSDGGPIVRSVYYVAPAALAGNYLRYSLDYIWSPLLDNDPAIPITLQKLEVYSYDPMP